MKKLLSIIILIAIFAGTQKIQAQRLQAVHGAADPQLAIVDVWIGISILPPVKLEDIPFRAAVPYTTVLANLPINVGIAPGNSTSVNDTLKNFPVVLGSGLTYAGVVRGVLDPAQFAPNPDGRSTALSFSLTDQARETSNVPGEVQFIVVHCVSDAPTVDLQIRNGALLADDAAYGDISPYVSLTPDTYIFDLTDASGANLVASFDADLSAYADSALVVFATGFLDPSQNQNGEELGLFAALPSGNVIEFPKILVGISSEGDGQSISDYRLAQNYPNPFNPSTTIEFSIPTTDQVTLGIYDISGKLVQTLVNRQLSAGTHKAQWDAAGLPSGVYFYRIQTGHFTATKKLMLLR